MRAELTHCRPMRSLISGLASFGGLLALNALVLTGLANFLVVACTEVVPERSDGNNEIAERSPDHFSAISACR